MTVNKGDILVFREKNVSDPHFKNFEWGKKYTVKDVSMTPNDDGELDSYRVIFFDNHMYGCLEIYLDKYFTTLDNFRDTNINNIISSII